MGGIYVWFQYWVVHIFCIYVLECNKKVVKNALKMYAQKRWGTSDFVKYYFFGKGKPVTLTDIGLAGDFEGSPSVKALTEGFISDVLSKPIYNADFSEIKISDVTSVPDLFSVGNSALSLDASCRSGSCSFTFSINDSFKDPLDIFDTFSGNFEIGTPYPITHEWKVQKDYGQ
ncbi:hypothetical protein [uncultured Microbulbifer sp.]|uniref:hypothetical protein n=1 Tax=uncultured Microbulbifer sp. TaxID=348147 RepID=UPI002636AED6|nr:hypothetical protein [uncultured Microbulbifer sp.]